MWLVVPSTAARGVLCYDMCPLVFSWCEQHRHRSSHFSDDRTHSNRSPLSQPATTSWFAIETPFFTCLHHFRCNSPVLQRTVVHTFLPELTPNSNDTRTSSLRNLATYVPTYLCELFRGPPPNNSYPPSPGTAKTQHPIPPFTGEGRGW